MADRDCIHLRTVKEVSPHCRCALDRSVTALANTNPASPAPSLPRRSLNHAVAHKAAPRLCRVRQAPSGHDGHLQKISANATFRRFRHQPVRLAHGSSGYAGKTRAVCPAVTPIALAVAYITPHYAPLSASVATLLSPATVRAAPRIAGVMQTWLLQPAASLRRCLESPLVVRNVRKGQSHELRPRHVPSRALRLPKSSVGALRASTPGTFPRPPGGSACNGSHCVARFRFGSRATHPPQGAPPTAKARHRRFAVRLFGCCRNALEAPLIKALHGVCGLCKMPSAR